MRTVLDKPIRKTKSNLTYTDLSYLLAAGRCALKRVSPKSDHIRKPLLRAVRRAANTIRNA